MPAAVLGMALAAGGAAALIAEVDAARWTGVGLALPAASQLTVTGVSVLAILAGEAAAVRRRWWGASALVLPAAVLGALIGLELGLLAPLAAACLAAGVTLAWTAARRVLASSGRS